MGKPSSDIEPRGATLDGGNPISCLELAEVRRLAREGTAREIREAAQLSMREVAREVGVSDVTVAQWERGEARPRGEHALRYRFLLLKLRAHLDVLGPIAP